MAHPEGPPMGQTFGSSLDAADDARKEAKEAKMWGPGDDRDPGDEQPEDES